MRIRLPRDFGLKGALVVILLLCFVVADFPAIAVQQGSANVIQPGSPGKPSRTLPAGTKAASTAVSADDVSFMQGMIMHHQQAVEMTALIPERTTNKKLLDLGKRISLSQSDEIKFMRHWLEARGAATMEMSMHGAEHTTPMMPGMLSYYKMLAAQTDTENCVAHNGSLIPVPGRDIEVQAWYQGGISVVDFTDSAHPREIAYFDRGPLDAKDLMLGGMWSAYWYNGYIYGSEIARGIDVLKLVPTKDLSANEIAAANLVHFDELNVQNQQHFTWPQNLVVARAYLDQLARDQAIPAGEINDAQKQLEKTSKSHMNPKQVAKLKELATKLDSEHAGDSNDAKRLAGLVEILKSPAE